MPPYGVETKPLPGQPLMPSVRGFDRPPHTPEHTMRPSRLLQIMLVGSLALCASVAHAVPFVPTRLPASIDTLSVVAPDTGSTFTVLLGSSNYTYAERVEEGKLDSVGPTSKLTTKTIGTMFATRQGTEVRVAAGSQTFRFDPAALPPSALDLTPFDNQRAIGLGESASGAPKVALWSSSGLSVASVGSLDQSKAVSTLDQQSLPNIAGFWANDTFGVFAYAASDGTKVVLLDALGAPREDAPLTLEGVATKAIMATPLGAEVLVTRFAPQSVAATRIAVDGKRVEEKTLAATTVGLVADPKAPGGPDALVVAADSGNLSLTWWSEIGATGTPKAPRLVAEKVLGNYSSGACSANGCLIGFTGGSGHTLVWAGRDGSSKVQFISSPEEATGAPAQGGRQPVVTPYVPPSEGCSAASTHTGGGLGAAGFLGIAVMVGALRRRVSKK